MNYLLSNLKDNSVDFIPSFDNRRLEPSILPAKIPLILINGSFGIGGGYMSSIPPHSIDSVIKATKLVLENESISPKVLVETTKLYPSYPCGGIVTNIDDVIKSYSNFKQNSKNSVKIRAKIEKDEKNHRLIITEIPYMKSLDTIKQSIKDAINDKEPKVQGIKNIIDSSEKGNINLIIICNKEYDLDLIINQLYKYTNCQVGLPLSLIATNNGKLRLYNNIKEIIDEWIEFRIETIKRISRNTIKNIESRIHILEGLIKVLSSNNIDKLIKIVKNASNKDDTIHKIMDTFDLTIEQATYIAELRLYSLNKFEINRLIEEKENLENELEKEISYLKSDKKIKKTISDDLDSLSTSKFIKKDNKLTEHINTSDSIINYEDTIEDEEFILILTKNNYLKKIKNSFKAQNKNGYGYQIGKIKEDDIPKKIITVNSRDNIFIFTTSGKLYNYKCYEIEISSLNSYGKNISHMINNEEIVTIISVSNEDLNNENLYIISSSLLGKIKMTSLSEFKRLSKSGIIYSFVNEGDSIISVNMENIKNNFSVLTVNSIGNAIKFNCSEIPINKRTSYGSNIFATSEIKKGVTVINSVVITKKTEGIILVTEQGFGKKVLISEFPDQCRAGKGRIATKFKTDKDKVACLLTYDKKDERNLILMASKSIINIKSEQIRVINRATYGTSLKVLKNEKIIDGCLI